MHHSLGVITGTKISYHHGCFSAWAFKRSKAQHIPMSRMSHSEAHLEEIVRMGVLVTDLVIMAYLENQFIIVVLDSLTSASPI